MNSLAWQRATEKEIKPAVEEGESAFQREGFGALFERLRGLSPDNYFDKAGSEKSYNLLTPGQQLTVIGQIKDLIKGKSVDPNQRMVHAGSYVNWEYIMNNTIWTRITQQSKDTLVKGI